MDSIEIPITKGYVALVDAVDADLAELSWRAKDDKDKQGRVIRVYAQRNARRVPNQNQRTERLHRVIMARVLGRALQSQEQVDHIDGDTLNNRRSNLRLATKSQNACNSKRRQTNTSGYKGIDWSDRYQKWRARIAVNGKLTHIGYFSTPELAHGARCAVAAEYHGEFTRTE